jgi:putative oxygen-independent coproporphyrinogen III oxidase
MIPLSLYVHFPWCVRKCPYCDFNSHALRGDVPEDEYVDALLRDLDFERDGEMRPLQSLFMGGGTPSLFSAAAIGRFLDGVRARIALAPDIEITLEANPGTADAGNFRGYRDAGVNRLSIGVQSLDAAQLQRLGRIHGPAEARAAVDHARTAGFDNLNLDMMFALPQQTAQESEDDLRALLALSAEHVSWYQLTLEPNTEFFARPPPLPDDDLAWTMQSRGFEILAGAGYAQYEVSAHARAGREARHNLNYWQFGDYLGIGAGAHAKRTVDGVVTRRARHKHPRTYLQHAGTAGAIQECGAATDLAFEFALNALRLNEGFALADFETRTGLPGASLTPALERAHALGLVEADAQRVVPTELGRRHLNRLVRLLRE